jgi:hypothetical protein
MAIHQQKNHYLYNSEFPEIMGFSPHCLIRQSITCIGNYLDSWTKVSLKYIRAKVDRPAGAGVPPEAPTYGYIIQVKRSFSNERWPG